MQTIWAEQALLESGWANDVRIKVDADNRIAEIETGVRPDDAYRTGTLLPAPANCHSHAFQRAMGGLTEMRGDDPSDSFWTWRKLMFKFLDELTPDQVEDITAFVQMEMLEAGYATNVEFHYLHHQPNGVPYDNLAELSERVAAAAQTSGIGLTLLPVAYQYGGLDRRELTSGQQRFGNDFDRFTRLLDGAEKALTALPADANLGVAPHSMRAVSPADISRLAALRPDGPVHMHLAETIAEVEEVQAALGARPVEWALDQLPLSARWCFIHLTQMKPHETRALSRTGAVAGLCPLTEANLGDGVFDALRWLEGNGAMAIGSDSNIRISLAEEMRQLDTTQRLRDHSRAALATPALSTGRRVLEAICHGGAISAGRASGEIAIGKWADMLALDSNHVDLAGQRGDTLIDCFAFTGDNRMITDVWSAGRHMVKEGRHIQREEICRRYRDATKSLRDSH